MNGRTAYFPKHQKEGLLKAEEFNFIPILLIVPFKVDLEIKEPIMKLGI